MTMTDNARRLANLEPRARNGVNTRKVNKISDKNRLPSTRDLERALNDEKCKDLNINDLVMLQCIFTQRELYPANLITCV